MHDYTTTTCMLQHSPRKKAILTSNISALHCKRSQHQKKPALTINGAHLIKWLAAFCVLDCVGAVNPFTTPVPSPTTCGCSVELKAMEERLRLEFYEHVRQCSGCMSPSPPPPSPSPPPPSAPSPSPPPPPKPPCATPVDFALVLDESGSMKTPPPDGSMEGANGSKAFAHQLVSQYFLGTYAARFSVVSFAANATTRVPWSYNAAEINAGIDQMTADGPTSISDGFEAARQLFADGGRLGVTKIVLLLLDGEQTVDAEFRVQSLFEPNTANRPRKPYKPLLASNDGRRSD